MTKYRNVTKRRNVTKYRNLTKISLHDQTIATSLFNVTTHTLRVIAVTSPSSLRCDQISPRDQDIATRYLGHDIGATRPGARRDHDEGHLPSLSCSLSLICPLSVCLVSLLSYRGQVFSLCSLIVAYLSLSLSLSLQISQRDQVLFEITMSGGGEGTARARLSLPTHSQRRPPREGGGGAAAEEAEEAEEETHPAVTGRPRAGRFGAARPSHAIRAWESRIRVSRTRCRPCHASESHI